MSSALPTDIVATLSLGPPDVLRPRFWSDESVRVTAKFIDAATGAAVDVSGVSFAFRWPSGSEAIAPEGLAVRLGVGTWACAIVPATCGSWSAVVRCLGPSMAACAGVFEVVPLPAGTPAPPINLVTSDDGLFLVLSPDGAAITY
jgi:hypothetical protein